MHRPVQMLVGSLVLLGIGGAALAVARVDGFVCTDQTLAPVSGSIQQGMMYEVARINDVFDLCSRPRAGDRSEEYLYTWGYTPKLERMLSTERFEFCAYDQARLQTVVAVYLDQTQGQRGIPALGRYLEEITRDYYSIPSASFFPDIRGKTPPALDKLFTAQLSDCAGDLRCRARIQGRIAGLAQYRSIVENKGFWNTATNGHGVYFSNDPLTFLEHKKGDDYGGLVCDLSSSNLQITDLAHAETETAMEAWEIRIPADPTRIPQDRRDSASTARGVYPYYDLPAYEMAGHKRILRFHNRGNIYLDKCAIEYRASCKAISVDNLKSCRAIRQIQSALNRWADDPQSPDADRRQARLADLGRYLIEQGGYRNTKHLLEALEERRRVRCPKTKRRHRTNRLTDTYG